MRTRYVTGGVLLALAAAGCGLQPPHTAPPAMPTPSATATAPSVGGATGVAGEFVTAWASHPPTTAQWLRGVDEHADQKLRSLLVYTDPANVPATKVLNVEGATADGKGGATVLVTTDGSSDPTHPSIAIVQLIPDGSTWLVDGISRYHE